MFTKFHNKPNSTGLGLYLVKKSIIQLGGTIRFESSVNKGSTFSFTIASLERPEFNDQLDYQIDQVK